MIVIKIILLVIGIIVMLIGVSGAVLTMFLEVEEKREKLRRESGGTDFNPITNLMKALTGLINAFAKAPLYVVVFFMGLIFILIAEFLPS